MAYGVKKVIVKVGDVVIVPPGVVHGWADIPDHVDYLSFRPSQNVMQSGWVNPTLAK
jgi:quercetin dioxygenase-like cupin family protein